MSDDPNDHISASSLAAEKPAGPESDPVEPMIEGKVAADEMQAAKWFTIAFMIAIALVTIFVIVFWISFVRSNIFGAN
jgi:heme/copper-type cytochrome/quinol oxidase subunit 2